MSNRRRPFKFCCCFAFCISVQFLNQSLSSQYFGELSWCDVCIVSFILVMYVKDTHIKWAGSSEFGTYRLCEQRRFRRACASAQSRQNLRCSLIQAVSQEEPSDRKPDPWPLWMAGHAQLKFVMTECSKTQIRLTGLKWHTLWKIQFRLSK